MRLTLPGSRSTPNFLRFQWIRVGRPPWPLLSRFSRQRSCRLSSCLSHLTTQLPRKSQSHPRRHGNEQLFHNFHFGRHQAPVLSNSRQLPRRMATRRSSSQTLTNNNSHALPLQHPIRRLSQAVRPGLLPMERAESLSLHGWTTHIRGQLASLTNSSLRSTRRLDRHAFTSIWTRPARPNL